MTERYRSRSLLYNDDLVIRSGVDDRATGLPEEVNEVSRARSVERHVPDKAKL